MMLTRSDERGSAVLEFLIVGVAVLVPLLYVLLTVLRVEAAVMASTQAVREAGRAFTMADSQGEGQRNAQAAARLALSDQGFALPPNALKVTCRPACLRPSSSAQVHLEWRVDLPWVPGNVGGHELGYPITVDSELRIDSYRSDADVS